jgi:hypothetical protein
MELIVQIPNVCNLRCPYCYGNHSEGPSDLIDLDIWLPGLLNIPGWPHVWLFGYGEPTVDPGCIEIAKQLLERGDTVGFITNLTNGIEKINGMQCYEKFRLCTSYHPHYWDIDSFIQEYDKYVESGFNCGVVQIVGYPPYINYLEEWKAKLEGKYTLILAFDGVYNGKDYPASYTDKEKEIVYGIISSSQNVEIEQVQIRIAGGWKKSRKCRVGMDYMFITNAGVGSMCSLTGYDLGNIRDGITPLTELITCNRESCTCYGLWKFIVPDSDAP